MVESNDDPKASSSARMTNSVPTNSNSNNKLIQIQELLASLSRQLQEAENTRGENIAPGDVELQANIKRIKAIMNAIYPTTDTDSDAEPYYTPEAVDGGEVPNVATDRNGWVTVGRFDSREKASNEAKKYFKKDTTYIKGSSRKKTGRMYCVYGCREHGIQSCTTRVRIRFNKQTNWEYEVAAQNPKACLSTDTNQKVTLYPNDAVKDANMNAAIGVDNKQFSKCGRHYGVPQAVKEKIMETIQNSTIKVGTDEMMNVLVEAGLSTGVTRKQIKNFLSNNSAKEKKVLDELQRGRENYKQPTTVHELKELDLCGMFAIDFEMSMVTEDMRKKIPAPLLQEIEKDHKNFGVFSTPVCIEDMKEADDIYEHNVPISGDGIFVHGSTKFCIVPIGTHSNRFDFANGNGHTKEFRPFFFGIGVGESTALMIVTFIAGQHFAKNVANIKFEFDVVSSWHSDMAKSFTSLQENLFPSATRLSCCIHILRNLETRLKAHFFRDDNVYNKIKQQAYMLKAAASEEHFGVLCQLFTLIWQDYYDEERLKIEACEDEGERELRLQKLMLLQTFVQDNLINNLFSNGAYCPSVGSYGQVPDTNFIEASMGILRKILNTSARKFGFVFDIRRLKWAIETFCRNKLILHGEKKRLYTASNAIDVKAVDGFKKLATGFEICSTLEDFKFTMNQRVHQCKHEGRDVLVLPAFKLDDDAFVEDDEHVRKSQELKVKEVTKENVSLFLRSLRGMENEEETRAFLKELTSDESLHSAAQHTNVLDMSIGALTLVDVFTEQEFRETCRREKLPTQTVEVLRTTSSFTLSDGISKYFLCRCIHFRRRCQCGHVMMCIWRESVRELDELGFNEQVWQNMRYHVALADACTTKTGARDGRAHNPNKINRGNKSPTFYSRSALNPTSPFEAAVKSANRNGSGKKRKYEKKEKKATKPKDVDKILRSSEKEFKKRRGIQFNDVTPEPTWEQFEKENPELSNVNFISEVRWDFSDELSEWEYRAIERLLELLENNGTRVPSGRYAYKDVTHRKNKTVEVDFKDLERLRWSTDKVSNGLWLSTSIIDLLLLIFLHEKESNYQVWSANWWSTGLSETKTRANEDAKINEMICTETFKIFTGNEVVNKIVLPVNKSNAHWILVVIDMKLKTISSYDSFGSAHPDVLNRIKKYLVCKAKAEGVKVTDEWTKSWTCETASCPRQRNGYDCGMFVLCCARCVLLDWPISYFEQKDTAKEEVFVFEEKHMINLRRRFILEIHKLHLTNRMPDGIRDDEDEDEFDKYDPSTCPQEYIPIIQKLEKLEIKPDEYYLWYKRFSRALSFHVKADQLWFEENNEMRLCFPGTDHDSWKWSKPLGRAVFRKLFPAFEYYINKHFGYEYTRMLKLIEKYDDVDALQGDETGYGQWFIREAEMQDKNERSARWLTRNF